MPLIVGGSDGSGTRSVVALLEKLGVRMNVDDRGTNDVHADEMGGWPPVVRLVLRHTKSGDYDVDSLPPDLVKNAVETMRPFISSMDTQGKRHPSKARGVSYGFKAPVSMLLVPFFLHEYGQLKFLQVVRDGRDIAFSGNQSPVTKFYSSMYSLAESKKWGSMPEVKGMQLWSEWNAAVAEWGERHSNMPNFDFLTIHTEDLIDPATKFMAVREVAGFVGADHLSNDELCCMVVQPEEFMGSHSKDVKGRGEQGAVASSTLKSRFGHWKEKLAGRDELGTALHQEGARGLQKFGYAPDTRAGRFQTSSDGYQCTLTPANCHAMGIKPPRAPTAPTSHPPRTNKRQGGTTATDSGACKFHRGMDYKGGGGDIEAVDAGDPNECCRLCQQHEDCKFITYNPDGRMCYLKRSQGKIMSTSGLISAEVA